jgi:drug/metabolite transporter (DMT)-like permease
MIGPDALVRSDDAWPDLAVIAAAACYAFASIYARRFRELGLAPIDVATGQLTASALILAPVGLSLAQSPNLGDVSWTAIAAVIALASASTAIAYVVYFRILAGAGAINVVLVTLLAPATSVLLGAALLGERLAARSFIGLACIALGLGLIDGRPWRALRRN